MKNSCKCGNTWFKPLIMSGKTYDHCQNCKRLYLKNVDMKQKAIPTKLSYLDEILNDRALANAVIEQMKKSPKHAKSLEVLNQLLKDHKFKNNDLMDKKIKQHKKDFRELAGN